MVGMRHNGHSLKKNRLGNVTDTSVARFASWRAFDAAADRGDPDGKRLRDIVKRHGEDVPGILDRLRSLYRVNEAEADIVVSTAHKAKGREFESVVVLEDFELPSDSAKRRTADKANADEADQMINLLYVACTRATTRLYLAPRLHDSLAAG